MHPIEILTGKFVDMMVIQPVGTVFTTSLWVGRAIVYLDKHTKIKDHLDTKLNEKYLDRMDFIMQNTHELLKIPLARAEAVIASTPKEQWSQIEYDGKNNKDQTIRVKDKSVRVVDIAQYVKESYGEVVDMVVDTIKDYSIEYRAEAGFGGSNAETPDWMGGVKK
jgi:uncharacterized protein YqgV (UPF0045/DUF77 family)